jgi:hypothetical protein
LELISSHIITLNILIQVEMKALTY